MNISFPKVLSRLQALLAEKFLQCVPYFTCKLGPKITTVQQSTNTSASYFNAHSMLNFKYKYMDGWNLKYKYFKKVF